ncbi:MAG: Serine/threonine protein kinase, partial [Candidatus Alkanophagales archaeon MCA70_species_1]|nr:Serine/threonine protein kinase [Candidatus Alkanophaga volatiphilum]
VLKKKIKGREEWKKTTPGLFDTAQRLANEATKLFKGKEYGKALEKYYESLRKFAEARKGAEGLKDEGLVNAIGTNIYNVKKNIIACKKAIGISFSEKARKSFDSGNYEGAISIYKIAIEKFEDAVKDAKEIGEHELVKSIEGLIKDAAESIENCYVAIDKREVENLFKESRLLHERAAELAKGGELFKAKDVLRDAEEKIDRAFRISTKRGFSDAISKLNFLLKTIRDEMNVIDDKIASGVETVDFSADIFRVKEEGEPEIEIPRRERKEVPAFFPAELEPFYSDIEYIGEGGFARVFKAVRIRDGKEVAVKIPISLDPETGKAFTKEIVNWSRLEHENIVELCDMNILPIPYLEMELCDKSLEEVPKPLEVEEATSIIFDVAKGLKHAHSEGIIHQDLKPSNILFKDGKAKITDWGLSKLKAGSRSSSITAFSPLYAAPEHFSKKFGKRDERTDIYQLGVIFYELVTGKLPFEGEDVAEISFSIINEEPTPPSEINPKSKGVEHIIMKCMAKRKEERYQSVDELIEDLAVYLKEEYKKSKDFRKSAFFLYELLLQ